MRSALLIGFFLVPPLAARAADPAPAPVDYRKEIQSVLRERCYACHGALKHNGKLRVDSGAAMLARGVIVPGKPGESELLARVSAKEDDGRMPPEGQPLKPEQIARFRAWIAQGARVPADDKPEPDPREHWSFRAPKKPPVPEARNAKFTVRNPIDNFVSAKWVEKQLAPVGFADRRILLRRVYLDLIGLPPTAEQAEDFIKDQSPNAYEKVVDQLLASPQYGERWGRHFLDIWRYSDWWGLGAELRNSQKHIWHWRDWTIENFNADLPYNEMLRQMLAADELYPTDPKKLRATGFLARPYFLFNRTTWLDEVVEHTGKGFLGLTFNCTKCHDHKYDPITQVNYYQMRAIFEPYQVRSDLVPEQPDVARAGIPRAFDCNLGVKTYLHIRGDERNPDKNRAIVPGVPAFLAPSGVTIKPVSLPLLAREPGMRPEFIAAYRRQVESRIATATAQVQKAEVALRKAAATIARTPTPPKGPKKPETPLGKLVFQDDFAKPNPDRWEHGPGVWKHANGKLLQQKPDGERSHIRTRAAIPTDFEARFAFTITGGVPYRSVGLSFDVSPEMETLVYVSASQSGPKVQVAYKKNGAYSYPPNGARAMPIPLNKPISLTVRVRDRLVNVAIDGKHVLAYVQPLPRKPGKLDLITYTATAEFSGFELRELPREATLISPGKGVSGAGKGSITMEKAKADLAAASKSLAAARGELKKVEAAEAHPKDPAFALRGSIKSKESNLETDATRLKPFPATSTGRRSALANWIAEPANPLTARVAVNHLWARHFGQPLVATVFDFGRKGTPPTHPRLLDWLAVELTEHQWSLKHLHRLMVTSNVYRLSSSSRGAETNEKRDEANRFLWRMNSQRMQAQVVRDSLLHLAGELDTTRGGPPVPLSQQETSRRRALYFFHSHNDHSKFLDIFDDASVLECYRRTESIVPQQGLALWNSKFALSMAASVNERLHASLGKADDTAFVKAAFELILGATPTPEESKACLAALAELRAHSRPTNGQDRSKRARAQLIQALLNHNDFVTVR